MEWLFIVFVVLFVVSKFGGEGKKTPKRGPTIDDPGFEGRLADWRQGIGEQFDRARWVPSSAARDLIETNPPPAWRGSPWADPLGSTTPEAMVMVEIKKHNDGFLQRQKLAKKAFFDTVEKNPLTAEQVHACICMDDNVMVVAAAGSGKTSTMVAKAGYVLGEGIAQADQILMLAFNAAAAKELGERVAERLKDVPGIEGISSQTFHAFGLTVIGAATGQKPRLAPWVDSGDEGKVMTDIAKELIASDKSFARDWDMFRTIYAREMRGGRNASDPDGYKNGRRGISTASGDVVRSDEERRIADWLFFWGVKFEYERKYEHETADEQHSSYHPDFFYPEHQLYHEHFAIDRDGKSPFGYTYLQSAAWKRSLHAEKGTELFETMSHEMRAGRRGGSGERLVEPALVRLEQELVKRGQVLEFDPNRETKGFRPTSGQAVVRLIQTFQKHVKNNGLTMAQLQANIDTLPGDGSRLELFLSIYGRMAKVWDQKLREGNYIDFEDMLIQAAEHIEAGRYVSPYRVVLADEFQDSSRARVRMLKALTSQAGRRAHLCVVGDDWQGINRFAGSDIAVMTEFEKMFGNATSLTLGTTFRCPPKITTVSSNFIQRNPAQIRKQVRTTSTAAGTPIQIFGFKAVDAMPEHIGSEIAELHKSAAKGAKKTKVLILGRYRNDEPHMLGTWQRRFGDRLDIAYKTVHASKGLEAEHVFLINMIGGNRGFPSQMEDDPVLQIAMPAPDPFPVAEERRLFYVALTRASRDIRIYTTLDNPSSFVNELQTMEKIPVEAIDGEAAIPCPKCHQGVMKVTKGKYGAFLGCSEFPKCDHKQKMGTATRVKATPQESPRPSILAPMREDPPVLALSDRSIEGDRDQRRLARNAELKGILDLNPDVAGLFDSIHAQVLSDTTNLKLEWEDRATKLRSQIPHEQPAGNAGHGWIDKLDNWATKARRDQMERDLIEAEDFYERITINSALKRAQRKAELQRILDADPEFAARYEASRTRLEELLAPLREQRKRDLKGKHRS